jgi:hypothetical protein
MINSLRMMSNHRNMWDCYKKQIIVKYALHVLDSYNNNNNNNNNKQRMWNVKTRVTPVAIGATGTISKSFRKYVSNIPGNHDVKELQKTAILGTAHILRKVLT